jgi:hypothetical protein
MPLNHFIPLSRFTCLCLILSSLCAASAHDLIPSRPPAPLLQSRGSDFITVLLQLDVSHSRQSVSSREEFSYNVQIQNESEPFSEFPKPWESIGEIYSYNKDYSASATASNLISTIGYRYVFKIKKLRLNVYNR